MTWNNWHKHVNWLNVYFIAGIPLVGCIAAIWTPLRLETAVWAVLYYFFTGMGAFVIARKIFPPPRADPDKQALRLATTGCGLTSRTRQQDRLNYSSLFLAVEPLKVRFAGGAVISVSSPHSEIGCA
jgi:hypothetical protein